MELWLRLLSLSGLALVLVAALKAMAAIITTAITETQKTKRKLIESAASDARPTSPINETPEITDKTLIALSTRSQRTRAALGLSGVLLATAQFALMQFGGDP